MYRTCCKCQLQDTNPLLKHSNPGWEPFCNMLQSTFATWQPTNQTCTMSCIPVSSYGAARARDTVENHVVQVFTLQQNQQPGHMGTEHVRVHRLAVTVSETNSNTCTTSLFISQAFSLPDRVKACMIRAKVCRWSVRGREAHASCSPLPCGRNCDC